MTEPRTLRWEDIACPSGTRLSHGTLRSTVHVPPCAMLAGGAAPAKGRRDRSVTARRLPWLNRLSPLLWNDDATVAAYLISVHTSKNASKCTSDRSTQSLKYLWHLMIYHAHEDDANDDQNQTNAEGQDDYLRC